ncbi:GNAT family N-acetyltransferase [Paenibacillus sp. FSL W8-0426]|uniref:GNAT family N-acetyltransferase n=1 Tax=Paenibacillus sp. FSL W8-0426 TaxID=2921714 RepID=UPI0030D7854B
MDKLLIRRARVKDYIGISALMDELHEQHVQGRPDIYRAIKPRLEGAEYEEWLETDNRYLFVAEDLEAGKIVGFASAQWQQIRNLNVLLDRDMLYINEVVVDRKWQGKGVGQRIMTELIELGKELQADSVELTVSSFNEGAQAFYEKLGFAVRSSRMEYILRA